MGLEERRRIKELQDTTLPGRVAELKEITGGGVLEMHLAYALGTNGYYSDNQIRDTLMKGL